MHLTKCNTIFAVHSWYPTLASLDLSSSPGSFFHRATTPSVKLHHESRQITVPQPERGSFLNRKMVGKWYPYSHHHLELVVVKLDHFPSIWGINKKCHRSGKSHYCRGNESWGNPFPPSMSMGGRFTLRNPNKPKMTLR